jgi:hypothetical protein
MSPGHTQQSIGAVTVSGATQMQNFRLSAPLVSGGELPFNDCETGKELIHMLTTDDWPAPPRGLQIEAVADDGRRVEIWIPYSKTPKVQVKVGEPNSSRR